MLKFGKITNIDYTAGKAKVQFDDNGIVSKLLPISVNYSLNDSQTISFDINTPVWCIMDEQLEDGVIGGAIYNKIVQPKGAVKNVFSKEFLAGTRIEYNQESHELKITGTSCKIIFHGGTLGGLVKPAELKTQLEKLTARVDGIINAINNGVPATPPAPDGGAALHTTIKAGLALIIEKESFVALENNKIKM